MRRAFTLIELLVVIATIALLSSVVLAAFSAARMKARDGARIANARQTDDKTKNHNCRDHQVLDRDDEPGIVVPQ